MQVRHPGQLQARHEKASSRRWILLLIGILIVAAIGYAYTRYSVDDERDATYSVSQEQDATASVSSVSEKQRTLKIFTGAEFRDLYNSIAYPNTEFISDETSITGNVAADVQIRKLAQARGYLPRSAPVTDVFRSVGKDLVLQERAAQPWLDMQAAAKSEGIGLNLTAAYRAADDQKQIFLSRLRTDQIIVSSIGSGQYDGKINQVLRTTAIPGYSRHHTGYTIDIGCDNNPTAPFESTSCFMWLSKENYKNAKTYGWIPSYPDGAGLQGPDPEAWEYVWVGKDAVIE